MRLWKDGLMRNSISGVGRGLRLVLVYLLILGAGYGKAADLGVVPLFNASVCKVVGRRGGGGCCGKRLGGMV